MAEAEACRQRRGLVVREGGGLQPVTLCTVAMASRGVAPHSAICCRRAA